MPHQHPTRRKKSARLCCTAPLQRRATPQPPCWVLQHGGCVYWGVYLTTPVHSDGSLKRSHVFVLGYEIQTQHIAQRTVVDASVFPEPMQRVDLLMLHMDAIDIVAMYLRLEVSPPMAEGLGVGAWYIRRKKASPRKGGPDRMTGYTCLFVGYAKVACDS